MKGRYWDFKNNKPEPKLVEFLNEKVKSVKSRVKEATGVDIEPIYYSAGFKDDTEVQKPYNLSKLLYFIVKNTPVDKRLAIANNISSDNEMWSNNDEIQDYNKEIKRSFEQTAKDVTKGVTAGAAAGAAIGSVIPIVGTAIGAAVGGFIGGVCSLFGW